MKMNKLIIVLVAVCIIFATGSVLDIASAASPKTIDKNSVMLNSEKTFSWETKSYSSKKIIVKQIKTSKKSCTKRSYN